MSSSIVGSSASSVGGNGPLEQVGGEGGRGSEGREGELEEELHYCGCRGRRNNIDYSKVPWGDVLITKDMRAGWWKAERM